MKYLVFGVVPMVIPSLLMTVENPLSSWKTHIGTDLQEVRRLASEAGYVFYVDPGPDVGSSVAYWGPEIRYGEVQPALSIGMDQHTNVDSLSFAFEGTQRTIPIVLIQNQETGILIPSRSRTSVS